MGNRCILSSQPFRQGRVQKMKTAYPFFFDIASFQTDPVWNRSRNTNTRIQNCSKLGLQTSYRLENQHKKISLEKLSTGAKKQKIKTILMVILKTNIKNPPTPRRVGIKSRPTDIDSPVDRYIARHPTLAKLEVVLFLEQSPCGFSPMGEGRG
jgi:hypothetical protein